MTTQSHPATSDAAGQYYADVMLERAKGYEVSELISNPLLESGR
jgi:hypothetical protein